jgi:hypothetical protein
MLCSLALALMLRSHLVLACIHPALACTYVVLVCSHPALACTHPVQFCSHPALSLLILRSLVAASSDAVLACSDAAYALAAGH